MSVGKGGKEVTYSGEDSKKVLEDVLNKEQDIDEVMEDEDLENPHRY